MAETETTPLLVDAGDSAVHIEHVPASAHFHRAIKRLTIAILVLLAVALLNLLIGFFLIAVWPFGWGVAFPQVQFLILLLIATFVSIINLNINVLVLLNLIVDIILSFYIVSLSFRLIMSYLFIDLCRIEKGYPRPPDLDRRVPPPGCLGWRLATWILLGIAFGLGLIIGLLHLVLVILRTIAVFRTKFWSLSAGEVTFQITFRVITGENSDSAVRRSADAPSTSPPEIQGPVAER
ncbi:hypothetical protein N431DRAFT_448709 [Stipitochalara longipes BDJ]|nr:hypothetical protein N431DRAFT_448709 [Stipitochalara longipes BDJ]